MDQAGFGFIEDTTRYTKTLALVLARYILIIFSWD
jgi:hypothetical protein